MFDLKRTLTLNIHNLYCELIYLSVLFDFKIRLQIHALFSSYKMIKG